MSDQDPGNQSQEKAKLYKRIVNQSPDWLVLERMKVHGFWPKDQGLPADPPEEAKERSSIEAELNILRQQFVKHKNPQKALEEERKRRWEESKARRAERKQQKAAEKKARQQAWQEKKDKELIHAGPGVSAGLEEKSSNLERLAENKLPVLHTADDVARFLNITLNQLRWLTYHRKSAALVHYSRYEIPKKTGGQRRISAPKPALAQAQQQVLEKLLNVVALEDPAHGFVKDRSILTNAQNHLKKEVVVNLDLKDFFPSLNFRRVKGLFKALGYGEHVATVLSLLCTEPPRLEVEFRGKALHVALSERVLPQGACTSPALTNLICRRLDKRLRGMAQSFQFEYSRYADDLSFSGAKTEVIGKLLGAVRRVIKDEGFEENKAKTHVMRRGRRQEVTGITVNDVLSVPRTERRRLRALLHQASLHGLESQNRSKHPKFAEHLQGKVAFVKMVNPAQGAKLQALLDKALKRA